MTTDQISGLENGRPDHLHASTLCIFQVRNSFSRSCVFLVLHFHSGHGSAHIVTLDGSTSLRGGSIDVLVDGISSRTDRRRQEASCHSCSNSVNPATRSRLTDQLTQTHATPLSLLPSPAHPVIGIRSSPAGSAVVQLIFTDR